MNSAECGTSRVKSMCNLGEIVRKITVSESEPLVGYRAWKKLLRPLAIGAPAWSPDGVTRADKTPAKNNTNGLYAFKSAKVYNTQMMFPVTESSFAWPITGTVEMWGTVVVHEFGYRASHARIKKIISGKEHVKRPTLLFWRCG